jgi:hypothetical protein
MVSESWMGLSTYALPDDVLLRLGHISPGRALIPSGVLGTHEHRDLDLVVPATLHQVDLLVGEQARSKQRQRHPHGHDDGQCHGEIAAQTMQRLGEDVPDTHYWYP